MFFSSQVDTSGFSTSFLLQEPRWVTPFGRVACMPSGLWVWNQTAQVSEVLSHLPITVCLFFLFTAFFLSPPSPLSASAISPETSGVRGMCKPDLDLIHNGQVAEEEQGGGGHFQVQSGTLTSRSFCDSTDSVLLCLKTAAVVFTCCMLQVQTDWTQGYLYARVCVGEYVWEDTALYTQYNTAILSSHETQILTRLIIWCCFKTLEGVSRPLHLKFYSFLFSLPCSEMTLACFVV